MRLPITSGDKHNRLTAVEPCAKGGWIFKCDCGNLKKLPVYAVVRGGHQSCGCLQTENRRRTHKIIHGGAGLNTPHHALYARWRGLIDRCYYPSSSKFPRYGGRGIRVCAAWRHDFAAFRDWAEATGFQKGLTIERKENDGPYSPENCVWATMKQQAANRCNTKRYLFRGNPHTIMDIAVELGVTYDKLYHSLHRGRPVCGEILPMCPR